MKNNLSKDELERVSDFHEYLDPIIKAAVKRGSIVFNPVKREIVSFADRNANVLQTNIIGKQLLFNKTTEDNILKAIGIDISIMKKTFKSSEYFKQFGDLQLVDQIIFAIPLIMLSKEFYINKKLDEAQFFYMSAFYKPYATVVFKYFGKYDVNEDQMRYTIEHLTERYDIKKQGNLIGVIAKMAESSFNNYIVPMSKDLVLTDRELHVIFTSGIYSRLNSFVQILTNEYQKNRGKYLSFEDPTFEGKDDSEGETFDRDIQSDTAIKTNMVKKAVSSVNKKPIDEKILDMAAKYGFVGLNAKVGDYVFSKTYTDMLKNILLEIVDKHFKELPVFFESLIGSFLFEINKVTRKRNSANDLKSAVFVNSSVKTFSKSPNNKNENNLRVRSMIEKFLLDTSIEYASAGATKKQQIKKAVHFYFVLIVQKG